MSGKLVGWCRSVCSSTHAFRIAGVMKTSGCRNIDSAFWLIKLRSSSLLKFDDASLALTEPSKAEVAELSLSFRRSVARARGDPLASRILCAMDSSCSRT